MKKRRNFCPFCRKVMTNFSRHLIAKHRETEEVKEYLSIKDDNLLDRKKKRQATVNKLRKKGNYIYNQANLDNEDFTNLLPVKRPNSNKYSVSNSSHINCKQCFGFFKKITFYRHKCISPGHLEVEDIEHHPSLRCTSELLIPSSSNIDELKKNVFPSMIRDDVSLVAQTDSLILKFGKRFYMNHMELHQISYVSRKMRDLAKLFLKMKDLNPKINNFKDCLKSENFDCLTEAVRRLSGFNKNTGFVKHLVFKLESGPL